MKIKKIGLLPRIIAAIIAGLLLGGVAPEWIIRIFVTFNGMFSELLGFSIPLIIVALVVPGIAELGNRAGKLLALTLLLAYVSTLFSGFMTYFSCSWIFPGLIGGEVAAQVDNPELGLAAPYFSIPMPAVFGVMTALVLAFVVGIGIAATGATALRKVMEELREIVERLISSIIVPLLPFYIFGIFLNMAGSGAAFYVISVFGKIIGVIFALHILLLLIQFSVAGAVTGRNPLRLLYTMLPAYMTALGTSSSAATIPVTLAQTRKNGVSERIASFCIPLCATIHLAGSVMKITATSLAICMMGGLPHDALLYAGFIAMLSVIMVAAPGVPGGAIMAATGVLQTILGFDPQAIGLMIAIYIAIDSFGTACNVTGDGAIALIMDRIAAREPDAVTN